MFFTQAGKIKSLAAEFRKFGGIDPLKVSNKLRNCDGAHEIIKTPGISMDEKAAIITAWASTTPHIFINLYTSSKNNGIIRLILQNGIDPNISVNGYTALMSSLILGSHNEELPLMLLEYGASPLDQGLLSGAISKGYKSVVRKLLEKGVDPNSKDSMLLTYSQANNLSALIESIKRGREHIALLLLENGADPKCRDSKGRPALFYAIEFGMLTVVKKMIDAGESPNVKSEKGNPAIFSAVRRRDFQIVTILLDKGADINVRNSDNMLLLEFAASYGSIFIMEELLLRGIDTKTSVPHGHAIVNGRSEMVDYLFSNVTPMWEVKYTDGKTLRDDILAKPKYHKYLPQKEVIIPKLEKKYDESMCPVCFDDFSVQIKPLYMGCGHAYCKVCICKLDICPKCRT